MHYPYIQDIHHTWGFGSLVMWGLRLRVRVLQGLEIGDRLQMEDRIYYLG